MVNFSKTGTSTIYFGREGLTTFSCLKEKRTIRFRFVFFNVKLWKSNKLLLHKYIWAGKD